MRSLIADGVVGVTLMLASFAYGALYCDNSLFTTDATDYLRAVDDGFWSNYFDARSMGLWGVISTVREHPEVRSRLWDYLERQDDAAAKRHFHVPLGFYPNILVRTWDRGDRAQRLATALEGGVLVAIIFFGLRIAGVQMFQALLAGILISMSPAIVTSTTDVSPHVIFLAAVMVAGFALARFLQTQESAPAVVATGAFAIAVATLELSLVVAIAFSIVVVAWILQRGWIQAIPALKRSAWIFFVCLGVAWPGGVIHGSYLLSYGVFIFLALFRRDAYFGHDPFIMTLMRVGQNSWYVIAVIAITAVAAFALFVRRRVNPYLQVFGLLTLGFAVQGLLNHFRSGTYTGHFIASLWVLFALCAQQLLDSTKGITRNVIRVAATGVVLLAALAATDWPAISMRVKQDQRAVSARAELVIGYVKRTLPAGNTIVSNRYIGLWRYYMPAYHIEKTTSPNNLELRPWVRPQGYLIIADPENLDAPWQDQLQGNPISAVGGFLISLVPGRRDHL